MVNGQYTFPTREEEAMRTFQSAASDHVRLLKKQEAEERSRKASEKRTRANAITQRCAPFMAAAATLKALMKADPDFKKFLKERVATSVRRDYMQPRLLASATIGRHTEQDGWRGEMEATYKQVNTEWYLVLYVSERGRVEFKIYSNDSNRPPSFDPENIPDQVRVAFLPVLEILQDKQKVYSFLLEKFDV